MTRKELLKIIKEAARDKRTELKLSWKGIETLPAGIGKLTNLTRLYLYNNRLTSVPKELGRLKNLTILHLSGNQLTSIPKELGQLTNLRTLYLDKNKLTSVPKELGQLTNLQTLYLDENKLTSVPKELGQLKRLAKLNLSWNKLRLLTKEMVDLGLEIKWEGKPYEGGIFLEGNPLESPPIEIVKKGTEAVREYFKSLEVEEHALNEVKVLLVGNGGAGKTSLVKRLTKNIFNEDEPKTHGVNIDEWAIEAEGETIKAHLWDYGGQGIMQATHRVFFSTRSIYILVLNAREEPDPEDWLMNIKSLGGQSPVMVVINKTDVHDYRLNEKYLLEKYPTIKGFHHISCKTGDGLEAFFEELKEKLPDVEMTKMKWGKDWLAVKERLEGLEEDYISYEEYEDICRQQDVREEGQQKTLIEFLHDLGVVLHFKEFSLEHMKILNPEWITEGIYKIINSKVLKEKKGVLDKRSLSYILNKEEFEGDDYEKGLRRTKYKKQEQIYVIDLMREFELCYEPYGGDGVFVPDLFEEKEPDFDFDYENCIRFYFEYEYLPGPVMPRFIVQRHGDIEGDLRWRTGVVLRDEKLKSRALVRADKRQRSIFIYVNGQQKRDYLAVIRKTILDINNSFQKLIIKECIPLPNQEKMAVEYAELIGYYLAGEENIFVGKLGRRYSVMKLLDGIESPEETQGNITIIGRDKAHFEFGSKKIHAGGQSIVATEGSIVSFEQHIHNALELQKAIVNEPEESESFAKVAKKTAFDIVGEAIKDIAKGQVKEAAKQIIELGKDLGPIIAKTAAYAFFKSIG